MRSSRAVATVLSGTVVGQIALTASTPFVSRLYTPAQVAALGLVVAIASPIGMVATLRWDAALPIPSRENEVSGLLSLGALCVGAVGMFTAAVVLWAAGPVSRLLGSDDRSLLVFIPLLVIAIGLTQLLTQLAIRRHRFSATARSKAFQGVGAAATQLGLPSVGAAGNQGLLGGYLAGQFLSLAVLVNDSVRHLREHGASWPSRAVLHRFRRMPLMLVPSTLMNALGLQLPLLGVAAIFTKTDAGHFAMAMRVIGLPASVVGLAVGQVFAGSIASSVRSGGGDALQIFDRASRWLAAAGALIVLVLLVAGPELFAWALGDVWRSSGRVAQCLSLLVAMQLVASPLAPALTVLERPGMQLVLDSSRVAALIGVMFIVQARSLGLYTASIAISIVAALFYLGYWVVCRRALVDHMKEERR